MKLSRSVKIRCLRVYLEKKSYVLVGFLFAFDVVLSLWGFDPLVKFSVSFAMYIIVDSYMFRTGEVVCIYVSKYLVVEIKVSLADVMQEEVFSSLVTGDLPAKVD